MKTLALLFALSLYLLPNPTHSTRNPIRLPTADVAAASATPVLDIDGDELQAGGTYYILSVFWIYGGVKLAHLNHTDICPSDVIMASELDDGHPIMITPLDPTATAVLQSTYQNLRFFFGMIKLCINNVFWDVQYDSISEQGFVKAGVVVSYEFKIEQVSSGSLNSYKITHCPFDICYNVGLYNDKVVGATRLALSDEPYPFVFKKAGVV